MDSFKDIELAFKKKYSDKTIIKVTNYNDENVYVIQAVPTDRIKDFGRWLDGMYAMDKASLKVIGGFNPLAHKGFFNTTDDDVIYWLGKRNDKV